MVLIKVEKLVKREMPQFQWKWYLNRRSGHGKNNTLFQLSDYINC